MHKINSRRHHHRQHMRAVDAPAAGAPPATHSQPIAEPREVKISRLLLPMVGAAEPVGALLGRDAIARLLHCKLLSTLPLGDGLHVIAFDRDAIASGAPENIIATTIARASRALTQQGHGICGDAVILPAYDVES